MSKWNGWNAQHHKGRGNNSWQKKSWTGCPSGNCHGWIYDHKIDRYWGSNCHKCGACFTQNSGEGGCAGKTDNPEQWLEALDPVHAAAIRAMLPGHFLKPSTDDAKQASQSLKEGSAEVRRLLAREDRLEQRIYNLQAELAELQEDHRAVMQERKEAEATCEEARASCASAVAEKQARVRFSSGSATPTGEAAAEEGEEGREEADEGMEGEVRDEEAELVPDSQGQPGGPSDAFSGAAAAVIQQCAPEHRSWIQAAIKSAISSASKRTGGSEGSPTKRTRLQPIQSPWPTSQPPGGAEQAVHSILKTQAFRPWGNSNW